MLVRAGFEHVTSRSADRRSRLEAWALLLLWSLSSRLVGDTSRCSYQFSYLGNRARYEFIELDMSTGLDLSIPSSRPLTFPGGQSKNGYRARWLIELGDLSSSVFQEKKKREKMEIKAIMTTWSTKSKTSSRSQFLTDKKHCVAGRLMLFWYLILTKKHSFLPFFLWYIWRETTVRKRRVNWAI